MKNEACAKISETEFLQALQVREARIAFGPFTARGPDSKGLVKAGRAFLNHLSIASFGTSDSQKFRSALDKATNGLMNAFPRGNRRYWGLARKGLNIFLRDCLYSVYLRKTYSLGLAEKFFEVPLDSLVGRELFRLFPGRVQRWRTVRGLTPELSAEYQSAASDCAAAKGIARVHLDVFWWGSRESQVTLLRVDTEWST